MTNPDYVLPSSDAEAQRLEHQAQLYGGMDFLADALATKPKRVLEVGCGTGHFARAIAVADPEVEVVALDIDAARIAWAREHTEFANVEFEVADLSALPFADGSFDLVFSRFVLIHYPDPVDALREQARVTRAGGCVLAYDMVHEGVWFSPPKPAFERVLAQTVAVMRERGLEPNQGLHLPLAFGRAGVRDVQHRVVPHSVTSADPLFDAYRRNWFETVASLGEMLGDELDPQLVDAATVELQPRDEPQLLVEITVLCSGLV